MKNIVEYETRNGRTYKKSETVDGEELTAAGKNRPAKGRSGNDRQQSNPEPEKGEANA